MENMGSDVSEKIASLGNMAVVPEASSAVKEASLRSEQQTRLADAQGRMEASIGGAEVNIRLATPEVAKSERKLNEINQKIEKIKGEMADLEKAGNDLDIQLTKKSLEMDFGNELVEADKKAADDELKIGGEADRQLEEKLFAIDQEYKERLAVLGERKKAEQQKEIDKFEQELGEIEAGNMPMSQKNEELEKVEGEMRVLESEKEEKKAQAVSEAKRENGEGAEARDSKVRAHLEYKRITEEAYENLSSKKETISQQWREKRWELKSAENDKEAITADLEFLSVMTKEYQEMVVKNKERLAAVVEKIGRVREMGGGALESLKKIEAVIENRKTDLTLRTEMVANEIDRRYFEEVRKVQADYLADTEKANKLYDETISFLEGLKNEANLKISESGIRTKKAETETKRDEAMVEAIEEREEGRSEALRKAERNREELRLVFRTALDSLNLQARTVKIMRESMSEIFGTGTITPEAAARQASILEKIKGLFGVKRDNQVKQGEG